MSRGKKKKRSVASNTAGQVAVTHTSAITSTTAGHGSTVVLWVMALVFLFFVIWIGVRAVQVQVVPARIGTIFVSLFLLALKVGFAVNFVQGGTPLRKLKSLGADLAFASISFDLSMYLGNVPLSDFGPIRIVNVEWVYITFGALTIFAWTVWMYPHTAAKENPSNMSLYLAICLGVIFYFGKIFLYILRG